VPADGDRRPAGDRQLTLFLTITVPPEEAELVAARLWELGTVGVEERPDARGAATELRCSFPTDEATRQVGVELQEDGLAVQIVDIPDELWRDAWKEHAEAVDVGDRLRVVPAWKPELEVAVGDRLPLRIDSAACFGSGTHATTRMLLAELERIDLAGASVLDVGCGSGILAVAAARLGASDVEGIDIDPDAVLVTAANAAGNNVVVRASTTPLEAVAGSFDVVLANISAATLTALSAHLLRVTEPGGLLLLSGMLDGQWRHVEPCFGATAASTEQAAVERVLETEGWTAVALRRL
jgi:ribosomal protein L11 methyltransferase